MTIYRLVGLLLGLLLLALVGANMTLAVQQETDAISHNLKGQAETASRTTAGFLRPRAARGLPLVDPAMQARVARAGALVPGLVHLAVVEGVGASRTVTVLFGVAPSPAVLDPAGDAPSLREAEGRSLMTSATALASGRTGEKAWVVAAIDASDLVTARDGLLALFGKIALGVAVLAALLAFAIARPIVRQLRRIGAIFADPRTISESRDDLTISELASLRDAAVLMQASRAEAEQRAEKEIVEQSQDDDRAFARRAGAALFAPMHLAEGGACGVGRLLGDAPPGAFFALAQTGDTLVAVVGLCSADDPVEALALAQAARRYVADNASLSPDGLVDALQARFGARRVAAARAEAGLRVLTSFDDAHIGTMIQRYAAQRGDARPEHLMYEIDRIFAATGAVAVLIRP